MAGSAERAREALRSRDFRWLLGTRLLSQFADGLFQAFLIDTLVFLSPEKQGTAVGVAKAFAVLIIPFSLLGPLSGVLIDRWSRRRILAVTPLLRAAAVVVLLVAGGHTNWLLYALSLVVVSGNRFYLVTAGAVMPLLVADQDLLVGNSMAGSAGTVITFLGLVVGTQVANGIHPNGLLALCALIWPVAAWLASRISDPMSPSRTAVPLRSELRKVGRDLTTGVRRLGATPAALGSIVSASFDQLLIGIITVLSVVVFKQEFHEGVASYGRIIGAGGVGVLVGAVTVGWFEPRLTKPRIVAMAFLLAGVVGLAVSPVLAAPGILVLSFTLGLTFPWRKIPADTIVQESVPDRFRGRVFALYDISFSMARVIAALLAIPLIEHLSTRAIVAMVGLAYLLWTPVLPWWVRRRRTVALRFYAGGRADETPRAVVIAGEEEPVELLRSWTEERDGERLRRFRLRTADGEILEVSGTDDSERWRLERELPADVARVAEGSSSEAFTTRTATVADAGSITEVGAAARRWSYRGLLPPAMLDVLVTEEASARTASWLGDLPTGSGAFVAERHGRIVGYVVVEPAGDGMDVESLYVTEDVAGTGAGKLLEAAADHARTHGHPVLTLWVRRENRRARRFYEKNGFRLDGTERVRPHPELPIEIDEVHYRMAL